MKEREKTLKWGAELFYIYVKKNCGLPECKLVVQQLHGQEVCHRNPQLKGSAVTAGSSKASGLDTHDSLIILASLVKAWASPQGGGLPAFWPFDLSKAQIF